MTVSEYAQYLLATFPADAEVVVKDTGCSCCVQRGRYYSARKPRLVQPVTSEYNDQEAPDEPDEYGYSDAMTNMVHHYTESPFGSSDDPFDAPKVAI